MVTVGQTLASPESGYTRYDDTNANITYINRVIANDSVYASYRYNGAESAIFSGEIRFNFTKSKLRLMGGNWTTSRSSTSELHIDNVSYGTINQLKGQIYQCLDVDINNLDNGEHFVRIIAPDNYMLDAIDIDSAGELKPYNASISTKKSQASSGGA